MDYGEVLTRAWQIIWKYKVLWLFGILAGCGSAAGSTGSSGNTGFRQEYNFGTPAGMNQFMFRAQQFIENIPIWVWVLLVLAAIVLFVILVVLSTVGEIGVVHGAAQGDEDVASLSFGPLFSSSLGYFWRVFLLNLLVGLVVFIVFTAIIVGAVLLAVTTLGVALVCLVPLLCIFLPVSIVLGWLIAVILQQSVIAMITENRGVFSGLERGWGVVRSNIGTFIVMALIIFLGSAIIGFLIALPMSLILIPIAAGAVTGLRTGAMIGIGVSAVLFILYLPVLILLTGVLRAYTTTAWTLTFRRLTRPAVAAPAPEVFPPAGPVEPLEPSAPSS